MAEETPLTSLPFTVRRRPDSLLLALELDVEGIVPADQPLEVGIAAVIRLAGRRADLLGLDPSRPAGRLSPAGQLSGRTVKTNLRPLRKSHVG